MCGKMSVVSTLLAIWACQCISTIEASESVSQQTGGSNKMKVSQNMAATKPSGGVVSFPLLSHDHVVRRRRRELSQTAHGRQLLSNYDEPAFDRTPSLRTGNVNANRHLAGSAAHQQLGALYQGYGTHYIDIWVGYPAQRQTAVVDTGSSATAFPCSECVDCGRHADAAFNETASRSFRVTNCPRDPCTFGTCDVQGRCMVAHEYGSGSDASTWIAFEAQDVAYAGGPHDRSIDGAVKATTEGEDPDVYGENPLHASTFSFPLTFGCQTSVSGYFEKQLASGVMGMDRKAQSFWGQMRASQVIHRAQFSLCFVKQPIASISGTTAGAVSLGGKDDRLHSTPMVFAKAMGHGATASFKVRVRKMYLRQKGGQSVMFDSNAAIHQLDADEDALNGKEEFNFDSGTTDTYFTKGFSDEFRKVWKDIVGSDYTNDPMPLSDSQLRNLPTVLLQMVPHEGGVGDEVRTNNPMEVPGLAGKVDVGTPNDVLFSIPATHYMQHSASTNTYTSRIYLDREDDMGSVLGSNAMMGHDILFDMDAARIGFAESECDYARLVAESGSASNAGDTRSGDSGSKNSVDSSESGSARNSSDSSNVICGSMKCRGLFGVTMSVIFICFFIFARRYITRRDDGVVKKIPRSEFEMKSSVAPRYSDDEAHLSGGERVLSPPPPRYSDRHSRRESEGSDRERGERSSRHISADGSQSSSSRSRDYPRSDGSQRSSGSHRSSRDYPRSDGSQRSSESHHSRGDRIQASGSIQSERSSRSMRSNGSHHSSRSHVSSGSHRSSGSRESHRSHSSHRSSGSRESSRRSLDRHSSDGEYEGRSSRRYRDDYGDSEIPMPPSIS